MPNKELGIADPVYDALRIRSGQSIAADLGGGSSGTGGLENKIYAWHADGSTIDTFDATAAGLALAFTAAATGDTIWLPSISIALTAGITLPAGVTMRGISNRATLSFSGFSGDAVTLSSGSVLQDCTVIFDGTGFATARGVVAPGVGCDIDNCSVYASSATTNIAAELTGASLSAIANTLDLYGEANNGTTAIGLRINDFVHAEHIFGQANSAATRNSGVSFACTSSANAGWYITGWGLSLTAGSAGMEVEVNKFANIVDGFARGVACGLLIGAGATAIVFALQWSSLCNNGTLTLLPGSGTGSGVGSGSTPDWFNVMAYGATGNGVTDDTAAIQDAIDAAAAAGGGTVFFPEGVYVVGGALQDGAGANAQLTLPKVHYTNDKWIGITLLGTAIPPASPDQASGQIPTGGSLIKGTLSAGAGGALLGGYGPAGSFGNFTAVVLEIKDLSFQLPANPVISALNLSYVSRVNVSNVVLSTGTFYVDGITEPTTATSYAIKSPNQNNFGGAEFDNVYAFGFYNAFSVTEHFIGSRVSAVGCKNGFVFSSAGHMAYLDKMLVVWCTVGIKISSKSYFNIEQYANERHDPTLGAKWYDRTYDVDDGSDLGYGSIRWHSTLSGGTGTEPPSFVVNGGANIVDVQAIFGWGASGVTSITAGTGLTATPNPITSTGTIALNAALNDLTDVNTSGEGTGDVIYDSAGTWLPYPLGITTKVTANANKIRIGGIAGGNYFEVDTTTGSVRLIGDATAWDDIRIAADVVKPGATAPNWKAFGPSGNIQALMFEAGHHDEAMFQIQLPHQWKVGTNIYPHIHWTPVNTTAGNVVWELEYSWANIDSAFGAPGNMATDATAAGGIAWVHKLTDLKESGNNYISGAGKTMSSMLMCRIHRNSNSGSDTLNQDVALLEVDFHFEIDSFGSDTRDVKDETSALFLESGDYLLLENGDNLLLE